LKKIVLDVSDLEAPQPLILAAKALRELGEDECLIFKHRMNPKHLFSELLALDMDYIVVKEQPNEFEMKIFKRRKN